MGEPTSIASVTIHTITIYHRIGKVSYLQHYRHIWENEDAGAYIAEHFSQAAIALEIKNPNFAFFIIYKGPMPVGILKIQVETVGAPFSNRAALYLEKIYLLKEFSGQGIGTYVLDFVKKLAQKHGKKMVWLTAMKRGPALEFYQKNGFQIKKKTTHPSSRILHGYRDMYILVTGV